ncbi:copper radical oxidase [Rhizoctonia solani AG-1 IA]|uniref:Copper radical oxidase n=1 Tax=Thanatephorus cucumeris (strain AG1-IA) TaxID=983506 RepID=L8WIJ9_THACA|nr:copper radical oxidase [Rhizoctonia solani AG-1 IA]
MAANSKAMKFNWETNTETRLPDLPNKQITVYPMSAPATAVLLPLTWENNYKPEVVIFGGSQLADTVKENEVSSQSPTSKQASRIALDAAGIANGWSYDEMPEGRVMADATILPDGKVLIMNGAKTGTAGYGNVPDQIGQSNADNPAFTPVLYDPAAPAGTAMLAKAKLIFFIACRTLLPDGRVMIAGSNPNADVETRPYKTEYQVEYISPPYMTKTRPTYTGLPAAWNYGQNITLSVTLPASLNPPSITVSLMDLGFSTHGVHMDMRMIKLKATLSSNRKSLVITGPPNASTQKVLIGTGASPPVNQGAIDKIWMKYNEQLVVGQPKLSCPGAYAICLAELML